MLVIAKSREFDNRRIDRFHILNRGQLNTSQYRNIHWMQHFEWQHYRNELNTFYPRLDPQPFRSIESSGSDQFMNESPKCMTSRVFDIVQ